MLRLYGALWWLALPLLLVRLWWRGRREPGYRQHVLERLGFYGAHLSSDNTPLLWIHAVSVGETQAAQPLIEALLKAYPTHRLLLTHMTATGRATGARLFNDSARVLQAYLPYDTGWMMARLLHHFQPALCVLMETEVWPNLIDQCARHQVPVMLANARLSERSLAKGLRAEHLIRATAEKISCVAAQSSADAVRLQQLGAQQVQVTGNLKFDNAPAASSLALGAAWREQFGSRPVLLCAVTRDGEEALILNALLAIDLGQCLLIIVPRHPQRFDQVAQLIADAKLSMQRRSQLAAAPVNASVQVLLGDSMGEMAAYYAACDVAFIGGSLLPFGGHNLIEACALGKAILIGPHTFNFAQASADAIAEGAALRIDNAYAMLRSALLLLKDQPARQAMQSSALKFAEQHRGATARTLDLLRPLIESKSISIYRN